jgi:threonine aldolase
MINLRNDYCYIAHEKILERMCSLSDEINVGYGVDKHCINAERLILSKIENSNSKVFFLNGGTITNKIFITHVLKPHEGIISCDTGHINVHETGAIRNKILLVKNINGKINVEGINQVYKEHVDEHMVKPRLVYISNSTEFGSIYSLKELEEISSYCKEHNLLFFIDGARLGASLTSIYNDVSLKDLGSLCDAFYIGGTKNGAMLGEALVINNQALASDFRYSIKHYGGMYSKGFISGIQFEVLFEDDLFYQIARKSNFLAYQLEKGLIELGLKMYLKTETNQVFVVLNQELVNKIKSEISFEEFGRINNDIIVRFVTHYKLSEDDIVKALQIIKSKID